MRLSKPIVGIPTDVKQVGIHPFHAAGEKYINAVAIGADCFPVLLPAMGPGRDLDDLHARFDLDEIVQNLDGLFLPGSTSNVDPGEYGEPLGDPESLGDGQRDATTLAMIRAAARHDLPLLAVCRGLQELNVAFGGTLHQAVHLEPEFLDHRENVSLQRAEQYGYSHTVSLPDGGLLRRLLGEDEIQVNSLHGQGVKQLAPDLVPEAVAADGLVEAASLQPGSRFFLGIQWHAEWEFWKDERSARIFSAFGDAVRERFGQGQ